MCGNEQSKQTFNDTQDNTEKRAALGGTRTHDSLQSRQSALPTELPGHVILLRLIQMKVMFGYTIAKQNEST